MKIRDFAKFTWKGCQHIAKRRFHQPAGIAEDFFDIRAAAAKSQIDRVAHRVSNPRLPRSLRGQARLAGAGLRLAGSYQIRVGQRGILTKP